MEYKVKFLTMILIILLFSLSIFSQDRRIASYTDISFVQSIDVYDKVFFSGGKLRGLVSLSYDFDERRKAYLSFSVGYQGPSTYKLDNDIKERKIIKSVFGEYHYILNDNLRIRPNVYFGVEKFRDSLQANYDDDMYNNTVKGLGFSVDLIREYNLTFIVGYRKIHYPNYTDLLSEMKYDSSMIKTGMYDKNVYEAGLRFKKEKWFSDLSYIRYLYTAQKVIKSDGTLSRKKQKDSEFNVILGNERKIGYFDFYPSINLSIYSSNQNYLRYKGLFDISPFFVKDAYSRMDFNINLPFLINFTNSSFNMTNVFSSRFYFSRPPRDENNNYIANEKQHQYIWFLNFEYVKNITLLAFWKVGYSISISKSNNRFEVYTPYNYTAHSFYLGYGIRY